MQEIDDKFLGAIQHDLSRAVQAASDLLRHACGHGLVIKPLDVGLVGWLLLVRAVANRTALDRGKLAPRDYRSGAKMNGKSIAPPAVCRETSAPPLPVPEAARFVAHDRQDHAAGVPLSVANCSEFAAIHAGNFVSRAGQGHRHRIVDQAAKGGFQLIVQGKCRADHRQVAVAADFFQSSHRVNHGRHAEGARGERCADRLIIPSLRAGMREE